MKSTEECLKKWLLKALRDYKSVHKTNTFYEPDQLAVYATPILSYYCNPYIFLVHPFTCNKTTATQILCKKVAGIDIDKEEAQKLLEEIRAISQLLALEAKNKHLQQLNFYLNHLPDHDPDYYMNS